MCVFTGLGTVSYGNVSKDHLACTYMVKDPFQLVTTPHCSMSFSSLCTRGTETNHLSSTQTLHKTTSFDDVNHRNEIAYYKISFNYGTEFNVVMLLQI